MSIKVEMRKIQRNKTETEMKWIEKNFNKIAVF